MVAKGSSHGHRIDLTSFFKVLIPLAGTYEMPSNPNANFIMKTLPSVLTAQLADSSSDDQKGGRRLSAGGSPMSPSPAGLVTPRKSITSPSPSGLTSPQSAPAPSTPKTPTTPGGAAGVMSPTTAA